MNGANCLGCWDATASLSLQCICHYIDSERSEDSIDFTMTCFFAYTLGGFRWKIEHPWSIVQVKRSNNDRNRNLIRIVETSKQQLPPPQQLPSPPPPALQQPPPQQQQQLITVPHVENHVTISRQLNGRNFYFVQPKNPLMVFSELFNDVQIHSQEHQVDAEHTVKSYTATIEIDDLICIGNDISETLAKQKACANFLRAMLEKQLTRQSAGNLKVTGEKINDNARMSRLICRKTPLVILHEWFVRVPIHVQQNLHDSYTATIEIDDAIYSGTDISKTKCKQKACENFLRNILAKKLNERSAENASTSKFNGPSEEKFPWYLYWI
ncbi:hypothetical protein AGLY_000986 [Aphis glycines]|uniref:DRBM domain-containing protein n=1 Tax=Aphis glycines TaxID=307491 RepID=A0A6G0U918_APHGL|nr:hypothetical protein AGLY_000986 [Aphis glycines]